MIQKLINLTKLKSSPEKAFVLGFVYAIMGTLVAFFLFPSYIGIVSVFFTSMAIMPLISRLIEEIALKEGREREIKKGGITLTEFHLRSRKFSAKGLWQDNKHLIQVYLFSFFGIFLLFSAIIFVLPQKNGDYEGLINITLIRGGEEIVITDEYILKDGDIISIDAGVFYKGFHTDSAITFGIGKIDKKALDLIDTTKKSLNEAIKLVRPGIRLGDISFCIQDYVEKKGFGIVRELVGHGIGHNVHELPQIPNYGKKGSGIELEEGMVLAIEPMVTEGDHHIKMSDDGWGVETKDGKLSAHFEHTVAVVKNGSIILT